jgi:hypothetical protein
MTGGFRGVDATMAASIAAGVWYSSVLRGRAFSLAATASKARPLTTGHSSVFSAWDVDQMGVSASLS